jgi:hypothetical protein
VGLLLALSGGLLGIAMLLRVGISVYDLVTYGPDGAFAIQLSMNLVGLLASGLLLRWGLKMRRGIRFRDPNANEIL